MPYKDKQKQAQYQSEHYRKYKNAYNSRQVNRRKLNRDFIFALKSLKSCSCGEEDILCLDYHHRNPQEKSFTIATGVKLGYAQETILREIEKCELLCANCHLIQHHNPDKGYVRPSVKKNTDWLDEYKTDKCCVLCGNSDPRCLCFHHLRDKKKAVATLVASGCSISIIEAEIEKCLLMCINCHRKTHNGNKWTGDSKLKIL